MKWRFPTPERLRLPTPRQIVTSVKPLHITLVRWGAIGLLLMVSGYLFSREQYAQASVDVLMALLLMAMFEFVAMTSKLSAISIHGEWAALRELQQISRLTPKIVGGNANCASCGQEVERPTALAVLCKYDHIVHIECLTFLETGRYRCPVCLTRRSDGPVQPPQDPGEVSGEAPGAA